MKILIIPQTLLLLILSFIAFSRSVGPPSLHAATENQELVFLNWEDYISPELIKAFETKFNVRVKQIYFETEEIRDEKLIFKGGKGQDVVLMSGSTISPYIKRKWVTALNFSKYASPYPERLKQLEQAASAADPACFHHLVKEAVHG